MLGLVPSICYGSSFATVVALEADKKTKKAGSDEFASGFFRFLPNPASQPA